MPGPSLLTFVMLDQPGIAQEKKWNPERVKVVQLVKIRVRI